MPMNKTDENVFFIRKRKKKDLTRYERINKFYEEKKRSFYILDFLFLLARTQQNRRTIFIRIFERDEKKSFSS